MAQTAIASSPDVAVAGMLADSGEVDIISRTNQAVAQVITVTIAVVANTFDYYVIINGVQCTYTSDGSATEAEINAGMLAAINDSDFNGPGLAFDVTAVQGATTATFIITADVEGDVFTYSVVPTNLTVVLTTANGGVVPFGLGIAQGDADNTGRLPVDGSEIQIGISVLDQMQPNQPVTGDHEYTLNSVMSVLKRGRIYVAVEDAVAIGGDVYVRHTTGANGSQLGSIRSDNDGGKAAQLTGAVFGSTQATPGGLAIIDINKP
jgi:hypothetical protein